MKLRTGFVSNSSSSSFICDICGEDVSGWDMGLEEAEMLECLDGHVFCEHHLKHKIGSKEFYKLVIERKIEDKDYAENQKELQEILKNLEEDKDVFDLIEDLGLDIRYEVPPELCPICSFQIVQDEDMVNYLIKKTEISQAQVFEKIKTENKRRRKLHGYEYIDYVSKQIGKTKEEIEKEILNSFKDYQEFYNYLAK